MEEMQDDAGEVIVAPTAPHTVSAKQGIQMRPDSRTTHDEHLSRYRA
jgi:hypothetical protein